MFLRLEFISFRFFSSIHTGPDWLRAAIDAARIFEDNSDINICWQPINYCGPRCCGTTEQNTYAHGAEPCETACARELVFGYVSLGAWSGPAVDDVLCVIGSYTAAARRHVYRC